MGQRKYQIVALVFSVIIGVGLWNVARAIDQRVTGGGEGWFNATTGVASGNADMDGNILIFDADQDTYLDASTDDVLNFYVGARRMTMSASGIALLDDLVTESNAAIGLVPNGTGDVTIDADQVTVCDGACPAWGYAPQFGVEGDVEIDGAATVEGIFYATAQSYLYLDSYFLQHLFFSTGGAGLILRNDSLNMFGDTGQNLVTLTAYADRYTRVTTPGFAEPHLRLGASTYAEGAALVNHAETYFDGDSWFFDTGTTAQIVLNPTDGGVILPVESAAAPSAPGTCRQQTLGLVKFSCDTNDGTWCEACVCNYDDGGGGYDWRLLADSGTACAFY